MGSSGVDRIGYKTQAISDWANSVVDALDVAYDDIDTLETDLAALEAIVDGLVTEGDYSTYTRIQNINPTEAFQGIHDRSRFTNSESQIMLVTTSDRSLIIITISDGSYTDTGYNMEGSAESEYTASSMHGKYYVMVDDTPDTLYIYKDGSLLQTISVDDALNHIFESVLMSPSGKYFIISYYMYEEAGSNRSRYHIYEGS